MEYSKVMTSKLVTDIKNRLKLWKYINRLFDADREEHEQTGPPIILGELKQVIRSAKNAVGPDQVSAELIKCIDEETLHT